MNELNKVAGYKIKLQKSIVLLYMRNELAEREIKKTLQFTIAPKK